MIAHRNWILEPGWRRVKFRTVNRLVNDFGWKWVTRKGHPYLLRPTGELVEFKLIPGQGAQLKVRSEA